MSQKNAKLSRRNFLLSVGAGGVAGAAAIVGGKQALQGSSTEGDKRKSRGYQETAHVNNYYRTAKV